MASDYRDALVGCSRPGFNCDNIKLFQGDGAIIDTVNATILVPVVIGMFWGATLVGREYDTGTNLLVWTQSVTRRHWLRTKIATLIISSALVGTALSVMVTWWSRTMNAYRGDNRFDPLQFDLQGLSPIAFTMFAAALGLLAGAAWRRTLPAIATTIAGFFGVRLAVELWLRPHYESPITVVRPERGDPERRVVAEHGPALQRSRDHRTDPRAAGVRVVAAPGPTDGVHDAITASASPARTSRRIGTGPSKASRPASTSRSLPLLVVAAVIVVRRRDA